MILTHFSQRYDSAENNGMTVEDLRKEAEEICGTEIKVFAAKDFDHFALNENSIDLKIEKNDQNENK